MIELVLSGDNALVIGAAAAGLPRRWRCHCSVRRVCCHCHVPVTAPAAASVGGLLLLVIAVRLLMGRSGTPCGKATAHGEGIEMENRGGWLAAGTESREPFVFEEHGGTIALHSL